MSAPLPITGGCLCGAVRYTIAAQPVLEAVCHCRNCQKQAGSAFSVLFGVPKDSVARTRTLTVYHDTGDSGAAVYRQFCGTCGSPVITEVPGLPDMIFIKAGTLDDPSWLKPTVQFYCSRAHPWLPLAPDTLNLATVPEDGAALP